jgi:hypothetical protein
LTFITSTSAGKLNRHKIRYRKYVESDLNFFEIKFKSNKNRTIKDRVREDHIQDTIIDEAKILLGKKTGLRPEELEPKFWVYFSRITLVSKRSAEANYHRP